jgi:hypothetical protein
MTLTKDIQYYASRARRFVEPLPRNSSMLFPPQRNALFLVQTLTKLPQRTTMVSARTPPAFLSTAMVAPIDMEGLVIF